METFRDVMPGQLLEPDTQVEWLLPGVAPVGARVLLTGPRGIGKTLLACELAVATATGSPFADAFRPWGANLVVLLTGAPREQVAETLSALLAGRGETDAPLLRILQDVPSLETVNERARLGETLEALLPRLLIVDPVERFIPGGRDTMYETTRGLTAIAKRLNVTIVLCGSLDAPDFQGAGEVLKAWADMHLTLEEDEARRQLLLTTEKRGHDDPLARLVIETLPGTGGVRFSSRPTEPLPELEARVYEQLRRGPTPLRNLRKLVRSRHSEVVRALKALQKNGLVEPFGSTHRIGRHGQRKFTAWRALPILNRRAG